MAALGLPGLVSLVAAFLLLNGFFVAMEMAVVSLRRTRVDEMVRDRMRGAPSIKRAKEKMDDFVASTQLGITVASLVIGATEPAFEAFLHPVLENVGLGGLSHPVAFCLALGGITTIHVVMGEQVPKMLAIHHPGRVALLFAPLGEIYQKVCRPAIWVLARLTGLILRLVGLQPGSHSQVEKVHSEEEIQALLGLREAAGLAGAAESEMISRVFSFFDMVATQVMVPRTEMVCVDAEDTLRDLVRLAAEERHERYPVSGENLDDIKGLVLLKDLILWLDKEGEKVLDRPVTTIMRDVLCVPGSLSVENLLTQMQKNRTRLAVVLDEFGGTAGMVTYGDLLERISGEVEEIEHPEEPDDIQPISEDKFRISGLLLIEDVESYFNLEIEDEHNDTIGGVVFSVLGRKPRVGDEVKIEGLTFRVESLDGLRIDRMIVERQTPAPEPVEVS